MAITAVHIQNFRSIASFKNAVSDLNVFVGQNDEGKSNFLRALDLFFNHAREGGFDLVWDRDYCRYASERKGRAKEITVELEVTPPISFSKREPILWRKVWRRDGLHAESIKHVGGDPLSPKSKLAPFLRSMRFDYVPAIKSPEFFGALLSSLHDMLEATVEEKVRSASRAFTQTINDNTKTILDEIKARLSLETTIDLPSDLRDLFAQLEFTSVTGGQSFTLSQRGDGIKMRHVPIVLRWLAEQANHLSAPGRPKVVTIWGYEEPENNLELRRCMDLAKELLETSSSIQTFVTTHSPAFYSVARQADGQRVQVFVVEKDQTALTTTVAPVTARGVSDLDSAMGFLDLMEPYFRDGREELARVREAAKKLTDTTVPTLYCEGPSDRVLLEATLELFYPSLESQLAIPKSPSSGGGHTWVRDMMVAWAHSRPAAKAVGLFDKDADAQATRKKVNETLKSKSDVVSGVSVQPSDLLKKCLSAHFPVPFAIDELLSSDVWDHAEKKAWLEERPSLLATYKFNDPAKSFADHLETALTEPSLRRFVRYKVAWNKKEDVTKFVVGLPPAKKKAALEGLRPTLEVCLKALGLL